MKIKKGDQVIVVAGRDRGRTGLVIAAFPDRNGKWQISPAGGEYPRWRGDGKELFFVGNNHTTLMAVDVDLTGSAPRTGTPKELFNIRLSHSAMDLWWGAYEVSPDGKRFLVNSEDQAPVAEPINLILNWDAELKR